MAFPRSALFAAALALIAAPAGSAEPPEPRRPTLTIDEPSDRPEYSPWVLLNVRGRVSRPGLPGVDIGIYAERNGAWVYAGGATAAVREGDRFSGQLHPPGPRGWPAGRLKVVVRAVAMPHVRTEAHVTVRDEGNEEDRLYVEPDLSGVEIDVNEPARAWLVPPGRTFLVRGFVTQKLAPGEGGSYVNCNLRLDGPEGEAAGAYVILLPEPDGKWWFEGAIKAPAEDGDYDLVLTPNSGDPGRKDSLVPAVKVTVKASVPVSTLPTAPAAARRS